MSTTLRQSAAVLSIDLAAIVQNWRFLQERSAGAVCASVVKADAYGLSAAAVVPALARAGCQSFFVATLDEAAALQPALAGFEHTRRVFVLGSLGAAMVANAASLGVIPVLNSLGEIEVWSGEARRREQLLPAAIHVDTGMSRLGLPPSEVDMLVDQPERLRGLSLCLIMSHLACAEDPNNPLNERQRQKLAVARMRLSHASAPISLANSAGIFLGEPYHADMVRPGAALYGLAPRPAEQNPMHTVVSLAAPILQVREIDSGTTVGYGATFAAQTPSRIATVGVGYADGFLRSLSNKGAGVIGGVQVPLVGRVSMDLATFDVSALPEAATVPGTMIELIGKNRPIDDVAAEAGTIGYEILTSLGRRYLRAYTPDFI